MRSMAVLAALAARLNRQAGRPSIPALYFFTDPLRTPDPTAIARRLPRGAAIVFRHFGAANRVSVGRVLKRIAAARGLKLLIGADPLLARRIGADGVHWPEHALPAARLGFALETAAAHSRPAMLRAEAAGMDACILSPVFKGRSSSAGAALGIEAAARMVYGVGIPVIALGGLTATNARKLIGRGFAGFAAVDALREIKREI